MLIRMGVKVIKPYEILKSKRHRESPIERTQDWIDTLDAIKNRRFEALQVDFSPGTLALGKATPDRFRRLLLREFDRMGRRDLSVKLSHTNESGHPILYVMREWKENFSLRHAEKIRSAKLDRGDAGASTPEGESGNVDAKHQSKTS